MKLTGFIFALLLSVVGYAEDHSHTPPVCAADQEEVCLHLGIHGDLIANQEVKFMVHFLVANEVAAKLSDLTVELWMDMGEGHGHGSSPVTITEKAPGKYVVTDAYFLMAGEWQVKVGYNFEGQHHEIIVPVIID